MDFTRLYKLELEEFVATNGYPNIPIEQLVPYAAQLFVAGNQDNFTTVKLTLPVLALNRAVQFMANSPFGNRMTKTKLSNERPEMLKHISNLFSMSPEVPYLKPFLWRIAQLQGKTVDFKYNKFTEQDGLKPVKVKAIEVEIFGDKIALLERPRDYFLVSRPNSMMFESGPVKRIQAQDVGEYISERYQGNHMINPKIENTLTSSSGLAVHNPMFWLKSYYPVVREKDILVSGYKHATLFLDKPGDLFRDDNPNRIYSGYGYTGAEPLGMDSYLVALKDLEEEDPSILSATSAIYMQTYGIDINTLIYTRWDEEGLQGNEHGFIIVDADPNTF